MYPVTTDIVRKDRRAKKVLFFLELDIEAVFLGIPVSHGLDMSDLGILPLWLEEVAEPFLGL
jgi:hypothetical protein